MINRAYIEVMTQGDAKGSRFLPSQSQPTTSRLTLIGESENADKLFAMTAKVRSAVFPKLYQFRTQAQYDPLNVLPSAARFAGTFKAWQRLIRLSRTNWLFRCSDNQLRSLGLPFQRQ